MLRSRLKSVLVLTLVFSMNISLFSVIALAEDSSGAMAPNLPTEIAEITTPEEDEETMDTEPPQSEGETSDSDKQITEGEPPIEMEITEIPDIAAVAETSGEIEVNGSKYKNMDEAMAMASDGDTVTVSGDFTEGLAFTKQVNVVISGDVNITGTGTGMSFSKPDSTLECADGGRLTITGFDVGLNTTYLTVEDGTYILDGNGYGFRTNTTTTEGPNGGYMAGKFIGNVPDELGLATSDDFADALTLRVSAKECDSAAVIGGDYQNCFIEIGVGDAGCYTYGPGEFSAVNSSIRTENVSVKLYSDLSMTNSEFWLDGSDYNYSNGLVGEDCTNKKAVITDHSLLKITNWGVKKTTAIGFSTTYGTFTIDDGSKIVVHNNGRGGFNINNGNVTFNNATLEAKGHTGHFLVQNKASLTIGADSVFDLDRNCVSSGGSYSAGKNNYIVIGGSVQYQAPPEGASASTIAKTIPVNGEAHGNEPLHLFSMDEDLFDDENYVIKMLDLKGETYDYSVKNADPDGNRYVWGPAVTVTFDLRNAAASFTGVAKLPAELVRDRGNILELTTIRANSLERVGLTDPTVGINDGGWKLDGWYYLDSDYVEQPYTTGMTFDQETTVYAKWDAHSIIYHSNFDTGEDHTALYQTMDSTADVLSLKSILKLTPAFERAGYALESWNTAADGTGTEYAVDAKGLPLGDEPLELYAKWARSPDFDIHERAEIYVDGEKENTLAYLGGIGQYKLPYTAEVTMDPFVKEMLNQAVGVGGMELLLGANFDINIYFDASLDIPETGTIYFTCSFLTPTEVDGVQVTPGDGVHTIEGDLSAYKQASSDREGYTQFVIPVSLTEGCEEFGTEMKLETLVATLTPEQFLERIESGETTIEAQGEITGSIEIDERAAYAVAYNILNNDDSDKRSAWREMWEKDNPTDTAAAALHLQAKLKNISFKADSAVTHLVKLPELILADGNANIEVLKKPADDQTVSTNWVKENELDYCTKGCYEPYTMTYRASLKMDDGVNTLLNVVKGEGLDSANFDIVLYFDEDLIMPTEAEFRFHNKFLILDESKASGMTGIYNNGISSITGNPELLKAKDTDQDRAGYVKYVIPVCLRDGASDFDLSMQIEVITLDMSKTIAGRVSSKALVIADGEIRGSITLKESLYENVARALMNDLTEYPELGGQQWYDAFDGDVEKAAAHLKYCLNNIFIDASDAKTKLVTHSHSSGGGGSRPDLDKENHFAYIIGRDDGLVHPEAEITRAEVATIFFRLLTQESRNEFWSQSNSFSDVASDAWYNNAVSTLSSADIIFGKTGKVFAPEAPITRAEFAAIAVRFFGGEYSGKDQFSDISGHWANNEINRAYINGLVEGYPDGTFQPDKNIARGEAMALVNRALGRAPHADHLLDDMIAWPDNMNDDKWYYADVQEATNSHNYETEYDSEKTAYEEWTKLLSIRDWAALENTWSRANSSKNPGEVAPPSDN